MIGQICVGSIRTNRRTYFKINTAEIIRVRMSVPVNYPSVGVVRITYGKSNPHESIRVIFIRTSDNWLWVCLWGVPNQRLQGYGASQVCDTFCILLYCLLLDYSKNAHECRYYCCFPFFFFFSLLTALLLMRGGNSVVFSPAAPYTLVCSWQ